MAAYTLFGQSGGGALALDAADYTLGVEFSVSQSGCTLTGVWWYSVASAVNLPGTIALYQVSGTSLVHSESASWSGAAGSGWVRAAFSSPPSLTANTAYKAAVFNVNGTAGNWYSATANYWSSGAGVGGITSGPLTAPNTFTATGGGQDTFTAGGALTYPATAFSAHNYWVDPEVTIPAAFPQYPVRVPAVIVTNAGWRGAGHSR